ncbi:HNH endonuclease [Mesomycoplasma hyorhinis]|uniref:HNH endonuclease n=6 Tax=Mesomycoplasma hyorhinis TaxID=2100 RepID=A0ABD6IDX6_MESHY|nr:HNH endonuclease [Mesomycoplasma hyorhinis]AEC45869.1 hypothetical protein SRH_01530 [Mesomycoplasma hyorhinis MCLD]AEX13916.1 hypothetical protein MYM_0114 [Mesomycoplasma hyorhinis GDL-1]AHA40878.1 hypothetical protein Q453_0124 [Mesomycoplasma hyorhinis DBS 1050]AOD25121.1 hypothetical protein MHMDBK_00133 [Mesomycoplasma hyorhinis]MXR06625.1 HNH endonuclease [Mesomycoplasma hyorhinis]
MEKNFSKITIQVPKEFIAKNDILKSIVELINYDFKQLANIKFEDVIWEQINERFQGFFIKELSYFVYITQKLDSKTLKTRSRNTFIKQNALPFIRNYEKHFKNFHNVKLFMSLNPVSFSLIKNKNDKFTIAESIYIDLKILISLYGFAITKSIINFANINEKYEEKWSNLNLETFIALKREKSNVKKRNKPIIFELSQNREEITVYAKLEGANVADSYFNCKFIQELNSKEQKNFKLFLFIIKPKVQDVHILKDFQDIGFNIINYYSDENDYDKATYQLNLRPKSNRNQGLFRANIIKKYNKYVDIYECFACEYRLNLVAAHIHRVADINKLKTHSKFITSAENGFQFCPNHDKEFENGMIYFDLDDFQFKVNSIKIDNPNDYNLLNKRIKNKLSKFKKELYSNNFKFMIEFHLRRIGLID